MDRESDGFDSLWDYAMSDSEESERIEMEHKNKYQFADVIHNDDNVETVDIIGDSIQVGYPAVGNVDLEWVGEFLNRHSYEYVQTMPGNGNIVKDIFRPMDKEPETDQSESAGSGGDPTEIEIEP